MKALRKAEMLADLHADLLMLRYRPGSGWVVWLEFMTCRKPAVVGVGATIGLACDGLVQAAKENP